MTSVVLFGKPLPWWLAAIRFHREMIGEPIINESEICKTFRMTQFPMSRTFSGAETDLFQRASLLRNYWETHAAAADLLFGETVHEEADNGILAHG